MKPMNTNARKQARRQRALGHLMQRPLTDVNKAEMRVLQERLSHGKENFPTKKLLVDATQARKNHRAGKMAR